MRRVHYNLAVRFIAAQRPTGVAHVYPAVVPAARRTVAVQGRRRPGGDGSTTASRRADLTISLCETTQPHHLMLAGEIPRSRGRSCRCSRSSVPELPRDDGRWGFEFKWDGIRAVARIERGALSLASRNRLDMTGRYPELRALAAALGAHSALLDGEIVGFDASGRPTFEALHQRMGLEGGKRVTADPGVGIAYMIFDVLALDGRSLLAEPYAERRAVLEALELDGSHWHTPPQSEGGGDLILATSREQRMEGVIAKRLTSRYEPGKRSGTWLKIKNQQRQEFVIGGWVPGEGTRSGKIGALVIGTYDGDHLVSAGKVGTGFSERTLGELEALLGPPRARDEPVRWWRGAARIALRQAATRVRRRVRRVDLAHRAAAPSLVQRAATRQGPARSRAGGWMSRWRSARSRDARRRATSVVRYRSDAIRTIHFRASLTPLGSTP